MRSSPTPGLESCKCTTIPPSKLPGRSSVRLRRAVAERLGAGKLFDPTIRRGWYDDHELPFTNDKILLEESDKCLMMKSRENLTGSAVSKLAIGASAIGSIALGAIAIGAVAVGAAAIGAVAVSRLSVRRGRIEKLTIGELTVERLVVKSEPLEDAG